MTDVRLSKRLAYLLRHDPDLPRDREGWSDVDDVLTALRTDAATLAALVREDAKQRYAVEGPRIRAQQGHSVDVDLGLAPVRPPDRLWHGTAERNLDAVLREGLRPGRRTHVHLSADPQTARVVGARHGRPVVLSVEAGQAWADGHLFRVSGNGVWLCAAVPAQYLAVHG